MKDRLKQFIDYKQLNILKFSEKISVNESTIRKILTDNSGIQSKNLEKIANTFPELNLHWLITGRGPMLLDDTAFHEKLSDSDLRIQDKDKTIAILEHTIENLTAETQQLREYVSKTSQKYISIVEKTLLSTEQTRTLIQFLANRHTSNND